MWIWIIVAVVAIILFRFFSSLNKDNADLRKEPLSVKFSYIISEINNSAFDGFGSVDTISNRELCIYGGSNQIVNLHYSTGSLTIIWRYKYFQKEMRFEKAYNDVRNISSIQQLKIAKDIINEVIPRIENFQNNVISGH